MSWRVAVDVAVAATATVAGRVGKERARGGKGRAMLALPSALGLAGVVDSAAAAATVPSSIDHHQYHGRGGGEACMVHLGTLHMGRDGGACAYDGVGALDGGRERWRMVGGSQGRGPCWAASFVTVGVVVTVIPFCESMRGARTRCV